MPSTSKSQLRFMRGCEHDPQHMKGKCPDMTKKQYQDFTKTPAKGLPDRASKKR